MLPIFFPNRTPMSPTTQPLGYTRVTFFGFSKPELISSHRWYSVTCFFQKKKINWAYYSPKWGSESNNMTTLYDKQKEVQSRKRTWDNSNYILTTKSDMECSPEDAVLRPAPLLSSTKKDNQKEHLLSNKFLIFLQLTSQVLMWKFLHLWLLLPGYGKIFPNSEQRQYHEQDLWRS